MPFDSSMLDLIGQKVHVQPYEGYGWGIIVGEMQTKWIEVPPAFSAQITQAIHHNGICRAVLAQVDLEIEGLKASWISLYPRTDGFIDLKTRNIGCNILIADTLPFMDEDYDFTHPRFIRVHGFPFIHGFGNVSLVP